MTGIARAVGVEFTVHMALTGYTGGVAVVAVATGAVITDDGDVGAVRGLLGKAGSARHLMAPAAVCIVFTAVIQISRLDPFRRRVKTGVNQRTSGSSRIVAVGA